MEVVGCGLELVILGFGVWGLGFGVWGLGFGVWGLVCNAMSQFAQPPTPPPSPEERPSVLVTGTGLAFAV